MSDSNLYVPWCEYCQKIINFDLIKNGACSCPYCNRLVKGVNKYFPEGTVLVWDEQEIELVYQFARFNIIDIAEIKRKEAIMREEDAAMFLAIACSAPDGCIGTTDEEEL